MEKENVYLTKELEKNKILKEKLESMLNSN